MRWLPVVGYEDNYEVSDHGLVRSKRRRGTRGGVLRPYVEPTTGYLMITLWREGKGKTYRVHSLVAAAYLGPRPEGYEVRHVDGDPSNTCRTNLAYGTSGENTADTIKHGRHRQVNKGRCPAGHKYTRENTTYYRGWRRCRECRRQYDAARRGSSAP